MTVTKEIRELAIDRSSADRIAAVAIEQGMRTLQQDGIDKVRMGLTSIQEIARITGSAMAAD
jgi:type IV pilus assembly protein PilB